MSQFKATVHGRVQGVCFRAETVAAGRRLGLSGYARNVPDGTVEVAARGEEPDLKRLLEFIGQGPELARVDRVDVDWDDATPLGEGFHVRY